MPQLILPGGTYEVDDDGFLLRFDDWSEAFAKGLAPQLRIAQELTDQHWRVIRFLRRSFQGSRACPTVYQTSEALGLGARDLAGLFPTGYARGACRLAGVTFRQGYYGRPATTPAATETTAVPTPELDTSKRYTTDVYGCLFYADEWDRSFAVCRAQEIGIEDLSERHWMLLRIVRHFHAETGQVPTVSETAAASGIDLDEMARLFEAGYHRGLLKVAGLRM